MVIVFIESGPYSYSISTPGVDPKEFMQAIISFLAKGLMAPGRFAWNERTHELIRLPSWLLEHIENMPIDEAMKRVNIWQLEEKVKASEVGDERTPL